MYKKMIALVVLSVAVGVATPEPMTAQNKSASPKLTTPKEQFGHDIGDDYFLVNYTQYVEYLRKLDQRVRPHDGRRDRQDGRRASRADGHHHVARKPQEARAVQGHRTAGSRSPKG